jgi:hypothetical protein
VIKEVVPRAIREDAKVDAYEPVEQFIATQSDDNFTPWLTEFGLIGQVHDRRDARQSQNPACRAKLPNEIGLQRSARHNDLGTFSYGLSHQVLKLATLVATHSEACEIISLHPKVDSEFSGRAI